MPLYSTKAVKIFNECNVLPQNDPNNIVLPVSKGCPDNIIPKKISVNCTSRNKYLESNLKVFKLARYRFPHTDVIDPSYDCTQFTKMQILENILNLSVCKLNSTNYQFWSDLAQGDVHYKEISPLGLESTK